METPQTKPPERDATGAILARLDAQVEQNKALADQLGEIKTYGPALAEVKANYEDLAKRLADTEERAKAAERLLAINRSLHSAGEKVREMDESKAFIGGEFLAKAQADAGRGYDLRRLMLDVAGKSTPGFDAKLERSVSDHLHTRAAEYGIDTAGGYLVPEEPINDFVGLLYATSLLGRAGATVLGGLTGSPVTIPTITAGSTHYWVGESEAITDSAPTFGEIEMTPKNSACLVLLSHQFRHLSRSGSQAIIEADMVEQMRVGEETAYLAGGGSKRPSGIFNESGILTTALGGAISATHFITMLYKLAANNSFYGNLAWLYGPRTWQDAAKLQDQNDRPVWNYSYGEGIQPLEGRIFGIPNYVSTVMNEDVDGDASGKAHVALVRASDVLLANWGGLMIARSEHHKFAENQIAVRATRMVDARLRRPKALVLDSTVTAGA